MYSKNYLTAIHALIKTGHWLTDRVSTELKEFDISEPQFNVLRILRGRKGVPATVQEIQEQMIQRTSNVTRLIDKLLNKQLVQRQECPTNRRKMDITITEEGLSLLLVLDKKVQGLHQTEDPLTEEEIATLTELILKLIKGIKS